MKKINLGCGPYSKGGWIDIDINPNYKPDIVRDITKGLPFDDDSIDAIHAHHFLEHLSNTDMLFVLEECYRVLKLGSQLDIVIPMLDYDIDHLQIFDNNTLDVLYRPDEMRTYYRRNMAWGLVSKNATAKAKGKYMIDSVSYIIKKIK